jgi:ATP-binding cassette subfamily F protein 3
MTVLLQITAAHKRYGEQVLLEDAEATLHEGQKVGFIGRNGAGKSTLLRVLLGEEQLDRGSVQMHPRLRIGYLRQHDPFEPGESGLDFLQRDSGRPEWKCGEVAGRFEIKGERLHGPVSALSGGWQTRLKLAALLLQEPTLLLLDEPTNFLDLRTQMLLEEFLKSCRQSCLIVSHDRTFLQATCSATLELAHGKLNLFPGPVEQYLEHRQQQLEHQQRVNAALQVKRRQLETFIAKNRARASTASQARSKSKQLEKLQLTELPQEESTVIIQPPQVTPRQGPAVRCRDLEIGYPEARVAGEIELEIEHGWRVAIVGDNGQGKTTLLRSLVGDLAARAGEVQWGYGTRVGLYAQHVYRSLKEGQSVLEYLERQAEPGTVQQAILDMAGAMLFRGDQVHKPVAVLSGGERARLCLAGLLLQHNNILVLDEPGNHLDVDTLDALAQALQRYAGTVILTSHDRYFVGQVANCIVEVRDGRVLAFPGNYQAYLYRIEQEFISSREATAAALPAGQPTGAGQKNGRASSPADAGVSTEKAPERAPPLSPGEHRKLRKELQTVERKLEQVQTEKARIHAELMACTEPARSLELFEQHQGLIEQLEGVEQRWCELQALLDSPS